MSAQSYIEETYEGGLSAYVKSQNDRYGAALASGDTGLIARLNADAARVGYNLNPMTVNNGSGGATSVAGGVGAVGSITPQIVYMTGGAGAAGSGAGGSRVGGVTGYVNNTIADLNGSNAALSNLGVLSGLSDFLPFAVVGAVILFFVKVVLD